jgi:hypothetical protein
MHSPFARRGPDVVTEELAAVLSAGESFEFKPLFDVIHVNLKARNAASGGEEMLRLRTYEKLQTLVQRGIVNKLSKIYQGVPAALARFTAEAAEAKAKALVGAHSRISKAAEVSHTETSASRPKKTNHAQAQLPVRKAEKRHGKKSEEGGKASS